MRNKSEKYVIKTILFTSLALIAFAANSILARLALGEKAIDASSFTSIRLLSGAIVLWVIIKISKAEVKSKKGSWSAGLMLFIYALAFSFAYNFLDTGTGALILFGSVQITMLVLSILSGDRLSGSEWAGLVVSFSGFVYLVLPGVAVPSATGFILMVIAGISWGMYTIWGRSSVNPLMDTAYNFFRTIPLVFVLAVVAIKSGHVSNYGIVLAVLSGGLASGVGYTLWYIALGGLSVTQAAVFQLLVPVIAAFGGVIFVFEAVTLRLSIASTLILGGILLVVLGRYYFLQVKDG